MKETAYALFIKYTQQPLRGRISLRMWFWPVPETTLFFRAVNERGREIGPHGFRLDDVCELVSQD